MEGSHVDESLSTQGHKVRRTFQDAQIALEQSASEMTDQLDPAALRSEMQRFLLWAANLGLFHQDHSSLDYRLRDNEVIKAFTKDQLSNLVESLDEIIQDLTVEENLRSSAGRPQGHKVRFESPRYDQSYDDIVAEAPSASPAMIESLGDDEGSMLVLHFEDITEVVDQLFNIASQIRKPSTGRLRTDIDLYTDVDPQIKATYIAMRTEAEMQGISQLLMESRKSLLPARYETEELNLADEDVSLVQRLQRANHCRRQQFAYWKLHEAKSMKATAKAIDSVPSRPPDKSLMSQAQIKSSPGTSHSISHQPGMSGSLLSSVPALAKGFILRGNISTYSSTSRGLTVHGPSGEKANWPKPPHDTSFRRIFECPYCFFFCQPKYLEDLAWRTHLKHDLRPYICTYEKCVEPNVLYDSWEEWMNHEQWAHRQRIWRCPEHNELVFDERPAYEDHVKKSHATAKHQLLSPELLTAQESVSQVSDRPCPFCLRDFDQPSEMHQHVAGHLEMVALLALPNLDNADEDSQASNTNSNSANRNYAHSRTGDFESAEPPTFPENDRASEDVNSRKGTNLKPELTAQSLGFLDSTRSSAGAGKLYSRDMIWQWRGDFSEGSVQSPHHPRFYTGLDHPQNQTLGQSSSDHQSPLSRWLQEDTEVPYTHYSDSRNAISGWKKVPRPQAYDARYIKNSRNDISGWKNASKRDERYFG